MWRVIAPHITASRVLCFCVHPCSSVLPIAHRRTAYHHPEGNSYIERFHRSLKEEEVWAAEYRP
jgi:transposase InsO family protein